jgi:hypothetical protein
VLLAVPLEHEEATAATSPQGRVTRGGRVATGPGADLPDADQPGTLGSILTRIRRGP